MIDLQVLVLLIVIISFHTSHANVQTIRQYHDYTLGIGNKRVSSHYKPSNSSSSSYADNTHHNFISLYHAINNEIHRQKQQQQPQQQLQQVHITEDGSSYPYIGCMLYRKHHHKAWKEDMHKRRIHWKITYSSYNDNRICFSIWLNDSNHSNEILHQHSNKLTVLKPLPFVLKIDTTALLVFEHLYGSSSSSSSSTSIDSYHPMVRDVIESKTIRLSVSLNQHRYTDTYVSLNIEELIASYDRSDTYIHQYFANDVIRLSSIGTIWSSNSMSNASTCTDYIQSLKSLNRSNNIIISMPLTDSNDSRHCMLLITLLIAGSSNVSYVGISSGLRTLNNYARGVVQTGDYSNEVYTNNNLTGTNVIVAISDTGTDKDHCYFKDDMLGDTPSSTVDNPTFYLQYRKIVQYTNFSGSNGDYVAGHGTHVAGSMVGSCLAYNASGDVIKSTVEDNQYHGMAPDAKIAIFDIGTLDDTLYVPNDLKYLFLPPYTAGARIHSNSWGGNYWYDNYALEVDAYLHQHQDMAVFFAAGNSGSYGLETILSPGLCKNVIAVGAAKLSHSPNSKDQEANAYLASFSSLGGTPDNRIKPDIVSPGESIKSSKASAESTSAIDTTSDADTCTFTEKSGTSMATPIAAGNAALIRQYFESPMFWLRSCNSSYAYCKTFSPSGVLLKALVLHSGTSLTASSGSAGARVTLSIPDMYQGYGRLTLTSILPLPTSITHVNSSSFDLFISEGTLESFHQHKYGLVIEDVSVPIKVTISWYDPPSDVFSAKFLLHDLDLLLMSPLGAIYYGNKGPYRDELNNNEQVTVDIGTDMSEDEVLGVWSIYVQSKLLTETTTQNYSIVVTSSGYVNRTIESMNELYPTTGFSCNNSTTSTEVDIALFNQVATFSTTYAGWDEGVTYSVYSNISSYTNTWTTSAAKGIPYYQLDTVCLGTGQYYTANLTVPIGSEQQGQMLAIPHCGVFLSPLHTSESFYMGSYDSGTLSSNTITTASPPCMLTCTLSSRIEFDILLETSDIVGWQGAYYSLHAIDCDDNTGAIVSMVSVAAGTLAFNSSNIDSVCLPISTTVTAAAAAITTSKALSLPSTLCYALHLSIPSPAKYLDENISPTVAVLSAGCSRKLDYNVTYAKVCFDVSGTSSITGTITYMQPVDLSKRSLGQSYTNLNELVGMYDNSDSYTVTGSCTFDASYAEESSVPSVASEVPTQVPTQVSTQTPTKTPSQTHIEAPTEAPTVAVNQTVASSNGSVYDNVTILDLSIIVVALLTLIAGILVYLRLDYKAYSTVYDANQTP